MKDIYIFKDGQVAYSDTAPTTTDYDMIKGGMLQVVQFESASQSHGDSRAASVQGVDNDGSLYQLEEATLDSINGVQFHAILL